MHKPDPALVRAALIAFPWQSDPPHSIHHMDLKHPILRAHSGNHQQLAPAEQTVCWTGCVDSQRSELCHKWAKSNVENCYSNNQGQIVPGVVTLCRLFLSSAVCHHISPAPGIAPLECTRGSSSPSCARTSSKRLARTASTHSLAETQPTVPPAALHRLPLRPSL